MLAAKDEELERDLIGLLRREQRPMNLDEIFSILYHHGDRLAELMANSELTAIEKGRIKRQLERSTQGGLLESFWDHGQSYYMAALELHGEDAQFRLDVIRGRDRGPLIAMPLQLHLHAAEARHDRMLSFFCFVALTALFSLILFLIFP